MIPFGVTLIMSLRTLFLWCKATKSHFSTASSQPDLEVVPSLCFFGEFKMFNVLVCGISFWSSKINQKYTVRHGILEEISVSQIWLEVSFLGGKQEICKFAGRNNDWAARGPNVSAETPAKLCNYKFLTASTAQYLQQFFDMLELKYDPRVFQDSVSVHIASSNISDVGFDLLIKFSHNRTVSKYA